MALRIPSPEKIVFGTVAFLLATAITCIVMSVNFGWEALHEFGIWILVAAVAIAFLPPTLLVIVLAWEK